MGSRPETARSDQGGVYRYGGRFQIRVHVRQTGIFDGRTEPRLPVPPYSGGL